VEAYQLISGVYVKALHVRTKDKRPAMCTCITHARACARVLRFTRYYVLRISHFTRDLRRCAITSWHGVFNEQFIFVLRFYWLILPHLDCHVNHDWLHIERFQGAVPGIWADLI
jgi:hypothetical protein